jgi:hypothetical protein
VQWLLGKLCNLTIITGITPTCWHHDCYYMIAKKSTDPRLTKQRPLTLQETTRKITASTQRRRMVSTWNKLGSIDSDQHAYLSGGSTVEPAMTKRQAVEDALFYKKNLCVIDEDVSAAFI